MSNDWNAAGATPRVLIVEPNPRGHRLYYVRILVHAFKSQGRRVVVLTTTEAVESAEWITHLAAAAPEVKIFSPSQFALSELTQAATEAGAGLTLLLDGDHCPWCAL